MKQRQHWLHWVALVSMWAALGAGPQVAGAQPPAAPAAGFVVNSLLDGADADLNNPLCQTATLGQCTFRAAVQQANAHAGADSITFSVTGVITLSTTSPAITDTLTITGPGAAQLTIDGHAKSSVLRIVSANPNTTYNVAGLTLTNGRSVSGGGGVSLSGGAELVLAGMVITGNLAMFGGGLSLAGVTHLSDSTVSHNRATLRGGGIDSNGPLEIINSAIQENAQDWTVDPTAVSAQGVGAYSGGGVFAGGQLTMTDSLVLSNTVAAPPPVLAAGLQPAAPSGPFGAGVYMYDTSAVIQNSVIAGNTARGCVTCTVSAQGASAPNAYGGGLFVYTSGLQLEDSQVLSNAAEFGGGLYFEGGSINIVRTVVAGNEAQAGGGVGVYNAFFSFTDSVLRDNWATLYNGGGFYGTEGNLQFNGSRIVGNQAGGDGGGLFIGNTSLYIGFTQIERNASGHPLPVTGAAFVEPQIISDAGGGLSVYGSDTQIYNSAIISNSATLGGGIDNASALYIENTAISGNSANRDGGGLRLTTPPLAAAGVGGGEATVTMLHVTLAGNSADADHNTSGDGGGLFVTVGTTATLHSTLLGANLDGGGTARPNCAGSVQSTGYNLIESTDGCTVSATTGDQFGVPSGVQPLQANGGSTLSNGLDFDSLALDAADPDPGACIPQDQRNLPRPYGAGCDIGAFEKQPNLYLPLVLR